MKFAKTALFSMVLLSGNLFAADTTTSTSTDTSSSPTASSTSSTTSSSMPQKQASKMTCQDFLVMDESFQPKVIYWTVGKIKNKKETVDIMVSGTERIVPEIIEDCKKNPKVSFIQKVKSHL